MKIISEYKKLSGINQKMLLLTMALLVYGYLCRILPIYWFWESKTVGWGVFFISIISILVQRIREKKEQKKETTFEKIGIGILIFMLLIQTILLIVLPQTNAYIAAKEYLCANQTINEKVGTVRGIFLEPTGGISTSSSAEGDEGAADLNFIVKGTNGYIDLNIQLEKEVDSNWKITEIAIIDWILRSTKD